MFDIFTSVCTEWANLNDARYYRRQFPDVSWVRTRSTIFEAWSGPNIGGSAHPTKFWQGEEMSNRCFCHVYWHVGHCIPFQPIKHQILFSGPYGGPTLHVVYFYLLIEVRSIKTKDRNDILQSFG